MTRVTADRQQSVTPEPRVDAGVKELNEMTIGRTDDPENPRVATARASRIHVWDWITDPIWASGHGAASTGRTRPARQNSRFFSCIQGAVHTCNTVASHLTLARHHHPDQARPRTVNIDKATHGREAQPGCRRPEVPSAAAQFCLYQ